MVMEKHKGALSELRACAWLLDVVRLARRHRRSDDMMRGLFQRTGNPHNFIGGAYLDPLADKALIVSIYVSLGIVGMVPIFLVILVVSRDIMIVSAFLLAWLVGRPMPVRPLLVSKANTVAQILLAILILAEHAFGFDFGFVSWLTMAAVAVLTLLSIAFYLREWVRHMNSFGAGH